MDSTNKMNGGMSFPFTQSMLGGANSQSYVPRVQNQQNGTIGLSEIKLTLNG